MLPISPRSWVSNATMNGKIHTDMRISTTVDLLGQFMDLSRLPAMTRATRGDEVITLNAGNNMMMYSIM